MPVDFYSIKLPSVYVEYDKLEEVGEVEEGFLIEVSVN